MKISNQKPVVLSPVYTAKITGDFEPLSYMKETLATPLFNPLVQGQPITMTNNGNNVTDDDIVTYVLDCCGTTIDPMAEAAAKSIFGKTLVYFDANTPLSMQNLFAIQAAVKEKLPFPNASVIYAPATDVIPSCKEFLAGQCTYEKFFGSLAFYARPETLGFYFANETAFNGFKTWLAGQITTLSAVLPAQTNQCFSDFQNTNLNGLTESYILRNQDDDNNEEYSFARTLISQLMLYTKQISSAEFGVLPFNLGELYCPKSVVFVNVEKHARATAKQVADEWTIINNSLQNKINMISNNKLNKLTAAARSIKKIQGAAANAVQSSNNSTQKAKLAKFKHKAPSVVDIAKLIKKIIGKMASVAKSENTYKCVKMTFAKPNRRDPDDFNKQGKIVSVKYKPDLHVYIDTSGSISEENYQDTIKALIQMAKKMNVNLYFNSFSHVLSQCTKLNVKDKSMKQIYAQFQKVPKVTGGTDYEQIWNYINRSKKRKRELSLIITDFEYTAPNKFVAHPKNLYYISCSRMDWKSITYHAKHFCDSMQHIDPAIRTHLLL